VKSYLKEKTGNTIARENNKQAYQKWTPERDYRAIANG
jgi:hypothetical protein